MQESSSEKTLNRTDTWPNASTSYHEYRASRCNGCAAAAADSIRATATGGGGGGLHHAGDHSTGDNGFGLGTGLGDIIVDGVDNGMQDEFTSRLHQDCDGPPIRDTIGGSQPINLDVLRSTPHHTCSGHYATADAQFKVSTLFSFSHFLSRSLDLCPLFSPISLLFLFLALCVSLSPPLCLPIPPLSLSNYISF
jgi:hypothetical protein